MLNLLLQPPTPTLMLLMLLMHIPLPAPPNMIVFILASFDGFAGDHIRVSRGGFGGFEAGGVDVACAATLSKQSVSAKTGGVVVRCFG